MLRLETRDDFDDAYALVVRLAGEPNATPPITLHYHRFVYQHPARAAAGYLLDNVRIYTGSNILVVGCGFGALVEELEPYCRRAIGTDISPFIQAEKGTGELPEIRAAIRRAGIDPDSEKGQQYVDLVWDGRTSRSQATILDEDSLSAESRARVEAEFAGPVSLVVTEHVINGMVPEDAGSLCSALAEYGAPVVHIVDPEYSLAGDYLLGQGLISSLEPTDAI